jgi:muramoyltetrapeptide carboxypeptidase
MIGHVPKQFIVPNGAEVEMDADKGMFSMVQEVFGT